MSNSLFIERLEDSTVNTIAPVISIWQARRKYGQRKKRVAKKKVEQKIPLFYTAPIFKPKKHDFL
jgi:hypothetical protein